MIRKKFLYALLLAIALSANATAYLKKIDESYLDGESKNRVAIVVYPYSGGEMVAYFTKMLTKKPLKHLPTTARKMFQELPEDSSLSSPILLTFCGMSFTKTYMNYPPSPERKDKLILVLRNPKECCLEFYHKPKKIIRELELAKKSRASNFLLSNIQFYHLWPDKQSKLLIHYEELMKNPKKIFKQLAKFLNVPAEALSILESDLDMQIAYFSAAHAKKPRVTNTKGKLFLDSELVPSSYAKDFDRLFKRNDKIIWNHYIKRYAEKK